MLYKRKIFQNFILAPGFYENFKNPIIIQFIDRLKEGPSDKKFLEANQSQVNNINFSIQKVVSNQKRAR